MSKHTQGPWTLNMGPTEVSGVNFKFEIFSQECFGITSGQSQEHMQEEFGAGILEEECRANARLIAAAPENYACNIELAKIVRELCGIYGHPLPEASLERSDAAIRKATGG